MRSRFNIINYLFSIVTAIVQMLTKWAWREEHVFYRTFLGVKEKNKKADGSVDAELVMTKDDALVVCHAFASIFNSAANFTEMTFNVNPEFTKGWKEDETLVVHIFREKGLTPAQVLNAARADRDELQTKLTQLAK